MADAALIGVVGLPVPVNTLFKISKEYPAGSTVSQVGAHLWVRSAGELCWGCITCDSRDGATFRELTGQMHMPTFIVCPDCGNKRCPRATLHSNECSNSNEPGQTGSVYGPTPGCARCTYNDHGPGREAHVDGAGQAIR